MGFDGRWSDGKVAVAAFASTALLVFFGNGLTPHWPLVWLAPVPVLLFALRRPAWQAGLMAAGAWMVGCLNLWGYFLLLGPVPVAWFVDCGLGAVALTGGVLLTRLLVRRDAVWSAWIALPAVWVTSEYVRSLVWPHGSAGCIAYSQLNFLPFLQLASVAGPWGMGFVLMLFASGLAIGIHLWGASRRQAAWIAGATFGIVAAVLVFGAVRLSISQPGPRVKVGLVASGTPGNLSMAKPGAATEELLKEYAQQARGLTARGATVVVMPEKLGVVVDPEVAPPDAVFQAVADETGAVLVAGMVHVEGRRRYNEARIYAPEAAVRSYDKEHLLPPFEDRLTPGRLRTLWKQDGHAWGVAICKDMDFTNPARNYGRSGVGLMLVPAWDFNVDGFWHGHIAVMRAVEDGFSLVRSAKGGLLTVADNRGRIIAERPSHSAPFATLLAEVPVGHSDTLFLLLGDWFGWCSIAMAMLVLMQAARLGKRVTS